MNVRRRVAAIAGVAFAICVAVGWSAAAAIDRAVGGMGRTG